MSIPTLGTPLDFKVVAAARRLPHPARSAAFKPRRPGRSFTDKVSVVLPVSYAVCVVDDDADVRTLTQQIIGSAGFRVATFASAVEFLEAVEPATVECVVADLRMPGLDGTELLRRLRSTDATLSVVILTGNADVRTAVKLMEDGALSLLEKPYDAHELVQVVERAVRRTVQLRTSRADVAETRRRMGRLDEDAREVLRCMMAGMPNKSIVAKLDISPRTLDRRKQTIFTVMGVDSVSELAAMVTRAENAD